MRDARLDPQPAAFFPRLALHPADVSKHIAIAPAWDIEVNGENKFQRAVEHDLKIKLMHRKCERTKSDALEQPVSYRWEV